MSKFTLSPKLNVTVSAFEDGRLIDKRVEHNVFTNTGKAWATQLWGASSYSGSSPTPHTTSKIKYVGLGCGGSLQANALFRKNQNETVVVTALEDPVPLSLGTGDVKYYLKQVDAQTSLGTLYFSEEFGTIFIADILETEISFTDNETRGSGQVVGTSVPVSEVGLYLSDASAEFDSVGGTGADPLLPNQLVAYNIFRPIYKTPSVCLRVEWEIYL